MYLTLIVLPLLGSIASGFFGRNIGVKGSHLITCTSVIITTILAIITFFEVGFNNIPVNIDIARWVDVESLYVLWNFRFDSLTISMLLPVLIVSSLVHVYSVSYMSHDPHNQRFFSYLSLFTFMMIILVTGNNYLVMFIGHLFSAVYKINFIIIISLYAGISFFILGQSAGNKLLSLAFRDYTWYIILRWRDSPKFYASKIIVSYYNWIKKLSTKIDNNKDKYTNTYKMQYALSSFQKEALIGLMLGDGYLERIKSTHNTRLRLEQSYPEKEQYLNHLYLLFKSMVVMSPKIIERKPDKRTGLRYKSLYFWTLKFPCLNQYFDMFYKGNMKIIPNNLDELLTPIGLAYWIMDDGGKSTYGQTILHTRSFTKKEIEYLQTILYKNFGLITRLEEKKLNQWVIYIPLKQKVKLIDIVGQYMHETMLYKVR